MSDISLKFGRKVKEIRLKKKMSQGDLMPEAGVAFSRAIELQPFYADAHYNLGLAFLKRGLKREAAYEFKKANELAEANPGPSK